MFYKIGKTFYTFIKDTQIQGMCFYFFIPLRNPARQQRFERAIRNVKVKQKYLDNLKPKMVRNLMQ